MGRYFRLSAILKVALIRLPAVEIILWDAVCTDRVSLEARIGKLERRGIPVHFSWSLWDFIPIFIEHSELAWLFSWWKMCLWLVFALTFTPFSWKGCCWLSYSGIATRRICQYNDPTGINMSLPVMALIVCCSEITCSITNALILLSFSCF